MVNKLDIKEEMRAIDCRDRSWWDSLTEEEQSKVSIFVLMRYTSAIDSKNFDIQSHYLTMTNDFVNVHNNILRHHPQLQHQLLQLVGIGSPQYHPWIAPGKRGKKNKLLDWLAGQFPTYNDDELDLLVATNSKEDFVDRMEQQGMTPKDIKEMFK
jgi:hypothetical protein